MKKNFGIFFFFFISVYTLPAQEKIMELIEPSQKAAFISYFEDGYLMILGKGDLYIYHFKENTVDTFTVPFPKEMDGIYKLGHHFFVEGNVVNYACFNYDIPANSYRFHHFKVVEGKVSDYKNYPMKYAFEEGRYYWIEDKATVVSLSSGKQTFLSHHSLERDREIFRTPIQSYVENPNSTVTAFNSCFTFRGKKAAFIVQEPQSKEPLFCLHDIENYQTDQFRLKIPSMPFRWSTTKMLLLEDASKGYFFGAGYDNYDSTTGETGNTVEGIIELDFRQKTARFLNLSMLFTEQLEEALRRKARVFETNDQILMAYSYQYTMRSDEPKRFKETIISIDKITFEASMIYDEKSKFGKNIYLYKNKRIDWFVDYSKGHLKPQSIMQIFPFEN